MAIRFTQKAQNVLNRSLTYARDFGHTYIGSEHLLLGLMGEEESVASGILKSKGAEFDKVKDVIVRIAGVGTGESIFEILMDVAFFGHDEPGAELNPGGSHEQRMGDHFSGGDTAGAEHRQLIGKAEQHLLHQDH